MYCTNCLLKEDICKPGTFTNDKTLPAADAAMMTDFFTKGYIEKNDRELYSIISKCNITSICYYEYALFIYNTYKDTGNFTSLCKKDSAIKSIIDLLYWSFGNPEDDNNVLQKSIIKNIEYTLSKTPDKTETTSTVKTRLSQDLFRKKLFLYDPKCKICGLTMAELLIASHSKDWRYSTDKERVNVYNGFLLCAQHDKLYDEGFISFDDDGNILISSEINKNDYHLLNINENIKIDITQRHKKFLKWHREHKFKN